MKKHTKIYFKGMGITPTLYFEDLGLVCEWCESAYAVDTNHIHARGMGGSKTKDYIENLIALCRQCHNQFEAKKISKEEMTVKHLRNIPGYLA